MNPKPEETGTVAHYTKLEHLANVLGDKRLLIGAVANLQDPRESSMTWIDTVGIGLDPHASSRHLADLMISRASTQIRLLSTAGERSPEKGSDWIEESPYGRPRMWSQYGDSSRGFCVVLDRELLKAEIQMLAHQPEYVMADAVSYHPWLHNVGGNITIETGANIEIDLDQPFSVLNHNQMMRSIYFKKSTDWQAESEYRYLLFSMVDGPIFVSIERATKYVVLGTQFPDNQISQAQSLCRGLDCNLYWLQYQHPRYTLHHLET